MLSQLSLRQPTADTQNPYFADDEWGRVRGRNLARYLAWMQLQSPTTLMLMEAPGYRGCRVTGIPVTSRKVMLSGTIGEGYEDTHEVGFERYHSEQSATIVWETLVTLPRLPVIWNTFPFHPHQANDLHSNRTPRPTEQREGLSYIEALCTRFAFQQFVAVGNVAAKAFTQLGLPYTQIRHPAQGGKHEFVRGIKSLVVSR